MFSIPYREKFSKPQLTYVINCSLMKVVVFMPMKYTDTNQPLQCMMTNSTCYKGTRKMQVKGVLWHSTGANNPYLKRYVQPSASDHNYANLMSLLGKNSAGNDWNHIRVQAGLNCWIGKLADGTVTTAQTMPWDYRPWGCGAGKKGSCNDGWVQFECCEDGLTDPNYFDKVYNEACEITAFLCIKFNIDPHGTVMHNGVTVPTILCHADSGRLGLGTNHGDVLHWFSRFGKTMEDVRNDVAKLLNSSAASETTDREAEFMNDQGKFNEMFKIAMDAYRKELQTSGASSWSAEDMAWASSVGLIKGNGTVLADGSPNYMAKDFMTREQSIAVQHRLYDLIKSGK